MAGYPRIQRVPWTVQPQGFTGIDDSDSLAKGLAFAWNAAFPSADQASRTGVVPVAAPGQSVNQYGLNRTFVSASSQYFDCGTGPNVTFAGDMTVMCAYSLSAIPASGSSYILFGRDNNTGGRSYTFDVQNNAGVAATSGVRFYTNGGGGGVGADAIVEGRLPVSGDVRAALVVWSPSTNGCALYIDGALITSTTASTNPPAATTSARIGARAYSGFQGYMSGSIPFMYAWNRALTTSEIRRAFNNYWRVLGPQTRTIWVPAAAGGAPTAALTGYAATGSAGILVPAQSLAVTGNSATASRGTPVAALSLATTGNEVTASRGTPVASISLALTGQGATSSAGSVGVGGTTQAITGNAATASAGTATPALSLPITGNAAISAAGTVTPALSKAITGNAVTSSAGTPVAAISLALTGQGATASAGTVAVPGLVVPTGVAATASQGSVSPGITVALTGNAVTASRGTVSPAISLALAGLAGTSAAGIVVPGLSKSLTGNSATTAAGSAVPATGNITLGLTGNSATATAGALGLDQGVDSTWWMYTVPADDLTYSVAADDLTYGVGPDQLSYEIGV